MHKEIQQLLTCFPPYLAGVSALHPHPRQTTQEICFANSILHAPMTLVIKGCFYMTPMCTCICTYVSTVYARTKSDIKY